MVAALGTVTAYGTTRKAARATTTNAPRMKGLRKILGARSGNLPERAAEATSSVTGIASKMPYTGSMETGKNATMRAVAANRRVRSANMRTCQIPIGSTTIASHIFHDLGGTDLTARIVRANTRGTKTSRDPRLERFQFVNATTPPEIENRKLRMRAGLSL